MKYRRPSPELSLAFEHYEILSFNVDCGAPHVRARIMHVEPQKDGNLKTSFQEISLVNVQEIIIDPSWNEMSDPPKPEGFDSSRPITWGNLTPGDIPTVIDEQKLYASRCLELLKYTPFHKALFPILIERGDLPSGNEWSLVSEDL